MDQGLRQGFKLTGEIHEEGAYPFQEVEDIQLTREDLVDAIPQRWAETNRITRISEDDVDLRNIASLEAQKGDSSDHPR